MMIEPGVDYNDDDDVNDDSEYEDDNEADMRFVKNFTPPGFQAKNFTPLISLNFNSFSEKNTKK